MRKVINGKLRPGNRVLSPPGYAATVKAIDNGICRVIYDWQRDLRPRPIAASKLRFLSER